MTTEDNVTLGEAAKAVGLHFNTIRNWRKQGRLETAQKVIEKGVEIWVVSLSEVQRIATETNNIRPPLANNMPPQPSITPGPASDQQSMTTNPAALAIGEAVNQAIKPLAELIEKQSGELNRLNRENGELSTELRLLKERLDALETVRVGQEAATAPQSLTTVDNTPKAVAPPQPAQEPVKRGFWRRLIGG